MTRRRPPSRADPRLSPFDRRTSRTENNEVALIGPTSLGLSFVASGLEWKAGDSVVVYFDDYPSNVYPWTALRERGVEVRYIQVSNLGEITPEAVMQQVDKNNPIGSDRLMPFYLRISD